MVDVRFDVNMEMNDSWLRHKRKRNISVSCILDTDCIFNLDNVISFEVLEILTCKSENPFRPIVIAKQDYLFSPSRHS